MSVHLQDLAVAASREIGNRALLSRCLLSMGIEIDRIAPVVDNIIPGTTLVFRPGGPEQDGFFSDFGRLVARAATVPRPIIVSFSAEFQPVVIPSSAGEPGGVWNLFDNSGFEGNIHMFPPQPVTLAEGCKIKGVFQFEDVHLINLSSTSVFNVPPTLLITYYTIRGTSILECQGTGPMFEATDTAQPLVFLLSEFSSFQTGAAPLIHSSVAGANILLNMLDGSTLFPDVLSGVAGTLALIQRYSAAVITDTNQPSIPSAVFQNLERADQVFFDPSGTSLVATDVQAAIVELSTGGFITVTNAAAATLLNASSFSEGTPVYVQSFRNLFRYAANSGLTVDGITVLNTSVGGTSRYVREVLPDLHWQAQTDWFLDGTGNDENDGNTLLTPLASWDELQRRLGITYTVPATQTTWNVGAAVVGSLHFEFVNPTALPLLLQGIPTVIDTTTLVSSTPANPAANVTPSIETVLPILTTKALLHWVADGSFSVVSFADTASSGLISRPYNPTTGAATAYPGIGDTVEIVTYPTMSITKCSTKGDKPTQFRNLNVVSQLPSISALADNSEFRSCSTETGFTNCSLSGCRVLNASNDLSGLETLSYSYFETMRFFGEASFLECVFSATNRLVQGTFAFQPGNYFAILLGTDEIVSGTLAATNLEVADCLYGIGIFTMDRNTTVTVVAGAVATSAIQILYTGGATEVLEGGFNGIIGPVLIPCGDFTLLEAPPLLRNAWEPLGGSRFVAN